MKINICETIDKKQIVLYYIRKLIYELYRNKSDLNSYILRNIEKEVIHMDFICPVCGAEMTLRKGPQKDFYGCVTFFQTKCPGKRDLHGDAWGCDGDEPYYLNDVGSSMFQACRSDGFSYDEAAECAAEWQRQEENDHWK